MKKLLIVVAFLLAAAFTPKKSFAQQPLAYSSAQLDVQSSISSSVDLRVTALENVFKKYNSPLVDKAGAYVQTADKYGIDWKLLPSIAGLESTFGNAMISSTHNAYGWGGGTIYFNSWEEGMDTILSSLRYKYVERGATTVYEIGKIYAESPTWAVRVERFMNEISNEYQSLSNDHLLSLAISE